MSTCFCGIGEQSWTAEDFENNQYLTIDLGSVMKITSIATQGSGSYAEFVEEYSISYSIDDDGYVDYKELGGNVKVNYCHRKVDCEQ